MRDSSDEPLHRRLTTQIRAAILSGALEAERALPSIRQLANAQRVSVITVKRAYDDLEREGLIHARRGKGFFVNKLSEKHKKRLPESRFAELSSAAIASADADGLERERMRELFDDLLSKGGAR